jgi:hypothetical protein
MTPDRDVVTPTQPRVYPAEPIDTRQMQQDAGSDADFQEINARRARVENPELLRHLRGL